MIDWKRVAELRDEIGEDGLAEVATLFLEEVEAVLARLGPPERLEADLHSLKGSAANLGFTDFCALCSAGENLARAGQTDRVDKAAISVAYHASKRAFTSGLSAGLA